MKKLEKIEEMFGTDVMDWVDWNLSDKEIETATFEKCTDGQNIFDYLLVTTEKEKKYLYLVSTCEAVEEPDFDDLYNNEILDI
jgi:hypothetical protein